MATICPCPYNRFSAPKSLLSCLNLLLFITSWTSKRCFRTCAPWWACHKRCDPTSSSHLSILVSKCSYVLLLHLNVAFEILIYLLCSPPLTQYKHFIETMTPEKYIEKRSRFTWILNDNKRYSDDSFSRRVENKIHYSKPSSFPLQASVFIEKTHDNHVSMPLNKNLCFSSWVLCFIAVRSLDGLNSHVSSLNREEYIAASWKLLQLYF